MNFYSSKKVLYQRDTSKSLPGSASEKAKALLHSFESSVEPKDSSIGSQDHRG